MKNLKKGGRYSPPMLVVVNDQDCQSPSIYVIKLLTGNGYSTWQISNYGSCFTAFAIKSVGIVIILYDMKNVYEHC